MAKPSADDPLVMPDEPLDPGPFLQLPPAKKFLHHWWESEVTKRLDSIERKLESLLLLQQSGPPPQPSLRAFANARRASSNVSISSEVVVASEREKVLEASPKRMGLSQEAPPQLATANCRGDTDPDPEPVVGLSQARTISLSAASAATGTGGGGGLLVHSGTWLNHGIVSEAETHGGGSGMGPNSTDGRSQGPLMREMDSVAPHIAPLGLSGPNLVRCGSTGTYRARRHSRLQFLDDIYRFLEDPESSRPARLYDRMVPLFIMGTVAITLLQQPDTPPINNLTACVLEVTVECLFALEILIWFFVSPSKTSYCLSVWSLIDVLSVCPLAIRIAKGLVINVSTKDRHDMTIPLLLGFVPVVRLLKVLRRFQKFHLLLKAFEHALEAMPVFLFLYGSLILVFSTVIYMVEPEDNLPTLPSAIWLTVISMATVGYGDYVPKTALGRFFVSVLVFLTSLYMAIPLGIIGNAFSDLWADRDRILLAEKVRSMLVKAGYTEGDFAKLLRYFDRDMNGVLDLNEFEDMISEMNLGLSRDRTLELYRLADKDGSGEVDFHELVTLIFRNEGNLLVRRKGSKDVGLDYDHHQDDHTPMPGERRYSVAGHLITMSSAEQLESTPAAGGNRLQVPVPRTLSAGSADHSFLSGSSIRDPVVQRDSEEHLNSI